MCIFYFFTMHILMTCSGTYLIAFGCFFGFSVAKRGGAKTTARKEKGKTSLTNAQDYPFKMQFNTLSCMFIQLCLCFLFCFFDTIGSTCQSQKAKRGSQGQARGEERRA